MDDITQLALRELATEALANNPTLSTAEVERLVLQDLVARKTAELQADAAAMKRAQAALEKQRAEDAKAAREAQRQAEVDAARAAAEAATVQREAEARVEGYRAQHAEAWAAYQASLAALGAAAAGYLDAFAAMHKAQARVTNVTISAAPIVDLQQVGAYDAEPIIGAAIREARGRLEDYDVYVRARRTLEGAWSRA